MKSYILCFIAGILILSSCEKYLDKVPNAKLTIPTSLTDFQQLLDNEILTRAAWPGLGDVGTDDLYLADGGQSQAMLAVKNSYIWAQDIFEGESSLDWNNGYKTIYYANIVLEGLQDIEPTVSNQAEYNRIKGSALFFRAYSFYSLEELFGQPYKPATIGQDLGIPLRLNSNLEEQAVRSTVKNVYAQIESDLLEAKQLLPHSTDFTFANRPTKVIAFALLARVYLTKQDYQKAAAYADSSLGLYATLTDYKSLTTLSAQFTFRPRIAEVMFDCSGQRGSIDIWTIDSAFLLSYASNDVRRGTATSSAFFRNLSGRVAFKGSYTKDGSNTFNGFATDEMYLIRAECHARKGNVPAAMIDLNTLLAKRYNSTFVHLTATDANDALKKILVERRKQLIFRGLRWADLRRLNQDPNTAKTLTRTLPNGQVLTLPPNDPRYTYPIPPDEIVLSGIQQNPR